MCGEFVGDECVIFLLLGMGLDEFFMSVIFILCIKKIICNMNFEDVKVLVEQVFV